jgi:hypothetical protein
MSVELVTGVVDYGDAPEIYVSGPARVTRVSNGLVRMSYYAAREEGAKVERQIVLHVLRDIDDVPADLIRISEAVHRARQESPINHP